MIYLHDGHPRILLIDQNRTKQNLRATILRNYEIEVHTADRLDDAGTLCARHLYDLVLLAAQENSVAALAVSARIREISPRQRIGLLVGPPAYVQELGGRRRKAASITRIQPRHTVENPSEAVPSSYASSPQWQEMIRKLVTDWYVDQNSLVGLSSSANRIAGA
jgi:CheY-like chemotaxis protein